MKNKVFVIGLALILLIFLASCATQQQNQGTSNAGEEQEVKVPPTITGVQVIDKGDSVALQITFSGTLEGNENLNVLLKSDSGNSFTKTVTLNEKSNRVEVIINKDELRQRLSEINSVEIKLSNEQGVIANFNTQAQISLKVDRSVVEAYESQYQQNAKSINKRVQSKYFTVNVEKLGLYNYLTNIDWGPETTKFRVDVTISNKDSKARPLDLTKAKLIYKGREYSIVAVREGSEIKKPEIVEIPAYGTKSIDLLFNVPSTTVGGTYTIIVGSDVDDDNRQIEAEVFV